MREKISSLSSVDFGYIARSGFWVVFGKVGVLGLSLVALYVFGNYAPKEVFGAYSYILAAVAIAGVTTLPGMNRAIVRAVAHGKEGTLMRMASVRFRFGLLGAFGLALMGIWYALHGETTLALVFAFGGIAVPFINTFNELTFSFYQGRERFDVSAKLSIVFQLVTSGTLVATLLYTNNLVVIVGLFYLATVLSALVLFYKTRVRVKNEDADEDSVRFGFHLTAIQGLGLLATNADKIILWHLLGPVSVATYALAQMPVTKLWQLLPIQTLALPKLAKRAWNANTKRKLLVWTLVIALLAVPVVGVLSLVAPMVFAFIFPTYLDAVSYFQVLIFSLVFLPFNLLGASFTAHMKTHALYILQLVVGVGQLVALLLLIPHFGLWGAIWALMFGYALRAVTALVLFIKMRVSYE